MKNIFSNTAPAYWAAGLPVIPLRPKTKIPAVTDWSACCSQMPDEATRQAWLSGHANGNIGLALGPQSGLCAIDIDSTDPVVIAAIVQALPASAWHRIGKKGKVIMFRYAGQKPFKLRSAEGMVCELLAKGNQVVIPTSIHPETNAPYTADAELLEVYNVLPELPADAERRVRRALASCGIDVGKQPKKPSGGARSASALVRFPGSIEEQVSAACEHLRQVQEGGRNDALYRVALPLAEKVISTKADWQCVSARLAEAADATGTEGIEGTLASAWGAAQKAGWHKVAEEWAYIASEDVFFHLESGKSLTPRAFDREFNSCLSEGGFISSFLTNHDHIEKYHGVGYDPTLDGRVIERDGRSWVNSYRPSNIKAVDGDPSTFVEFLSHLVPDADERAHLLKVLAHLVRHPGVKLHHAIILGSRAQGVGKSTLLEVMMDLCGRHNSRKATHDELTSNFHSFFLRNALVLVEELNLGSGRGAYNMLKDMITGSTFPMNRKGKEVEEIPNKVNFIFLTNLAVPLLLDEDDRRFFVIDSPATKRPAEYYTSLHEWLRRNMGVVRAYLDGVDLTEFNPFAPPPMTEAKRRLISSSIDPAAMLLREMIDSWTPPFNRDVVLRAEIEKALREGGYRLNERELLRVLEEAGAKSLGQYRVDWTKASVQLRFLAQGALRPSLWGIRNVSYWSAAPNHDCVQELLSDKGSLHWGHNLEAQGIGISYDPMDARLALDAAKLARLARRLDG